MGWNRCTVIAVAAACALVASACGRSASTTGAAPGNVSPVKGLVAITPAGTKPVPSVVWAINRDVISLDPIYDAAFPEYTADSLMCESLLRQAPDGSIEPGLATVSSPSPTTMVFTLRPGVKFWDGHPVAPADVVYSLDRQFSPNLGGYNAADFSRVALITATGTSQVTIKLKQPDYWLEGELASIPGIVIEKSFAEKEAKNYGTPAGSIMCTGAYMLKSWTPGVGLVAVRNPHYWNPSVHPLAGQITLKPVPDAASVTAGLLTGAIQGDYAVGLPTLDQLKDSSSVKVYQGPGWSSDVFAITSLKGVLGNLNVRRALSLALNRQAIINSAYQGAAQLPRWLANPGTFGYGKAVFDAAYGSSPVLTQNIAEARKLVQAGRGHRKDDHYRHQQPASGDRGGDRRLPGRRPGDRAQSDTQVGVGPGLHQLFYRSKVPGRHRRAPGGGLRRLRRPGGNARSHCPAGRDRELRPLQRSDHHRRGGTGAHYRQPQQAGSVDS